MSIGLLSFQPGNPVLDYFALKSMQSKGILDTSYGPRSSGSMGTTAPIDFEKILNAPIDFDEKPNSNHQF